MRHDLASSVCTVRQDLDRLLEAHVRSVDALQNVQQVAYQRAFIDGALPSSTSVLAHELVHAQLARRRDRPAHQLDRRHPQLAFDQHESASRGDKFKDANGFRKRSKQGFLCL